MIFITAEKKARKEFVGTISGVTCPKGQKAFAFVDLDEESAERLRTTEDVTFTIVPAVWKGDFEPKSGLRVVLSKLAQFDTGWRAMLVRPITPEDLEEAK